MRESTTENISQRAQHLLKVLIERYIREGQPIGSKTLAQESGLPLSSATIRTVLADLEEMGYLRAPHTSAGRVPTTKGYRLFVDSLVGQGGISPAEEQMLKIQLETQFSAGDVANQVSTLLSHLTHMAGIVSLPKQEIAILRQVEFLALPENRVLVILVTNEQLVQNRIIHTKRQYKSSELIEAANFINSIYAGWDMSAIRSNLLQAMQNERSQMEKLMTTVLEVADKMFDDKVPQEDFVVSGQDNLLDQTNFANMDKLKGLFEAFAQKQGILHLLEQCMKADDLQIFIGEESNHPLLDDCAVVTAPYKVEGSVAGVLGVIGPARMSYEKVIPLVDITAKLLSKTLKYSR